MIAEINDLHIDGLPQVKELNALVGKYVNLMYTLPNGEKVKFLDDQKTYLEISWNVNLVAAGVLE